MAIKITVSPRAKFHVEGTEKDESGKDVPFKFGLLAKRTPADELSAETRGEVNMADFMVSKVETWFDVNDDEGKPLEFSEDAFRQLLKRPGMALLVYLTYLRETGSKAKN